jgi:hypothetical protein
MNAPRQRRLLRLPRAVGRRIRSGQGARADRRLQPQLRFAAEAPALILSPHWDDAALDCWSVVSGAGEVAVVNLFAGVPQPGRRGTWEAILGLGDSAERARARMREDERALARAGRVPVNLPLLDADFRAGRRSPPLEQLDRHLADFVERASHVYVPAGIGSHVDHLLARRYGRALLAGGMPVSLYAELPYCIFHGWPAWVDGSSPTPGRDVDAYWRSFLGSVPEMPPLHDGVVVRLDPVRASEKLEAIGCYEASLNASARQLLAHPPFHSIEVHWRLQAPERTERRALSTPVNAL